VPKKIRQDNLSAATHELAETSGRALTKRFAQVVDHYDFESSRSEPGEAHQNGVVVKANDLPGGPRAGALVGAAATSRLSRSPRGHAVVEERFTRGADELAHERTVLALPSCRLPEHTEADVTVRSGARHVARAYWSPAPDGHKLGACSPDVVDLIGKSLLETMP
jgi:hypothetical protein